MANETYLYFDAAASAPPCAEAMAALTDAYSAYGNPSSLHVAGLSARRCMEHAREQLATAFRCKPEELIFTSSGTEASNQAIFGLAAMRGKRAKKIITTDSEHPSVEEPLRKLETQGFSVVRISTRGGVLDLGQLERELDEPIAFVSIMQANNETGAVYDIAAVRRALNAHKCDAPLHCDAVQGFLKLPTAAAKLSVLCDLVTLSAHKIGGVRGAGALYVKSTLRNLPPYLLGGGQERGLRSGTENVAAIAAFGAAAQAKSADRERLSAINELREFVIAQLQGSGICIHNPPQHLPNILHISIPNVLSSWSLNLLSEQGICVSAGSACSAHSQKKGNRVLESYGLPKEEIESALRISFTEQNTLTECERLCEALRTCTTLAARSNRTAERHSV